MDVDPLARLIGYIVLVAGSIWLLLKAKGVATAYWDASPKLRAVLGMLRATYLLAFFAAMLLALAVSLGGLALTGAKALLQ